MAHARCREGERADADSYHDLMRSRFGKWGGRAVALAQASLRKIAGGGLRKHWFAHMSTHMPCLGMSWHGLLPGHAWLHANLWRVEA